MLLLLLACPKAEDSAETGVDVDPATVALAGECPLDQDYGGFAVIDEGAETTVDGAVADGWCPSPSWRRSRRRGTAG